MYIFHQVHLNFVTIGVGRPSAYDIASPPVIKVLPKTKKSHTDNHWLLLTFINHQYRVNLYFVFWIKYHQSTPVQTISSEIKTISLNNLQWDYNLKWD